MHDEVVAVVAWLFRSLRLDVIVEPTSLFDHSLGDVSNQRPDIHIRNPRKSHQQVIIDVALTGVDGQSRTSDEDVVADAGNNADLYAANQGNTDLILMKCTRRRLRYASRVKMMF